MKHIRHFLTVLLLVMTVSPSWGQTRENLENRLLDAVQSYDNRQYSRAEMLLRSILAKDEKNDAAWYYLGLTEAYLGRQESAIADLEKAVALDPDNYWYRDRLAILYRSAGQTEKVIRTYEEMLEKHPKKTEVYFDLLYLYIGTQQYDKALTALDSIEGDLGPGEKIVTTRYEIYRRKGETEKAIAALEDFNDRYASPEVSTAIGDHYLGEYRDSVALEAYLEALSLDSTYAPALLGKSEVYRIRRDYPAYFSTLQEFISGEDIPGDAKGRYLQDLGRFVEPSVIRAHRTEFDSLYELGLEKHPKDSTMLSSAGVYYASTGRADRGKQLLRRSADLYPDSKPQNVNYLQLLYIGQEWEALRGRADTLMQRFPDEDIYYELSNTARYNLKDYEGIIRNGEERIRRHPADTSVTIPAYTMIGDMYHSLGEEKKSFKAYEKVLKLNPDYVPVLNNYAYYLSMAGKRLGKAYAMSKKTITAEPDNPTYLDTFGWILHLQGKDLEAKAMFKHAMLYGGKDSAVILDHYAEVLYALKEYDLAKVYWNLAISKNDGELKNLERKVKKKLGDVGK